MKSEYPPKQVTEEKTNLDATCVKASHRTEVQKTSRPLNGKNYNITVLQALLGRGRAMRA